MKYLLAVSGGVDSVVLLDMMSRTKHHLVVAHVDHGIRPDSAADARFVEALAKHYRLPFVTARFELGEKASEEQAREARYSFLFEQAKKFGAEIVTAHHRDDLVETIAINISRGTGWRGVAVLARPGIYRPLLPLRKARLYDYAMTHHLEWVEDSTNQSDIYHRNRLRRMLQKHLSVKAAEQLTRLRARQLQLAHDIEHEAAKFAQRHTGSRHFLTVLEAEVAIELLGAMMKAEAGVRPVRPQLERALLAIKTAKPGSLHDVGNGIKMRFTSRNYELLVV
jgi:tRNA(Ile)-lysidine synthase